MLSAKKKKEPKKLLLAIKIQSNRDNSHLNIDILTDYKKNELPVNPFILRLLENRKHANERMPLHRVVIFKVGQIRRTQDNSEIRRSQQAISFHTYTRGERLGQIVKPGNTENTNSLERNA